MLQDFFGASLNETGICINLRNRRQKVLNNISFESEVHNIYDPYFTSEEELDSMEEDSDADSEEEEYEDGSENSVND